MNLAARVMSVAHGGQSVFTDTVRDSAAIHSTDLGVHTLRDIDTPVHLNQLGDEAFPPLGSVGVGIVSLPLPLTSLVGREESVGHVRKLVASHRLVTITGVGGCCKTRLAIEVAYREVPSHPGGVWFVDLSTIADAVALPGAVASALDLGLATGVDPFDQIATYLTPREALLVVDNCEYRQPAAQNTQRRTTSGPTRADRTYPRIGRAVNGVRAHTVRPGVCGAVDAPARLNRRGRAVSGPRQPGSINQGDHTRVLAALPCDRGTVSANSRCHSVATFQWQRTATGRTSRTLPDSCPTGSFNASPQLNRCVEAHKLLVYVA